MKDLKIYDQKWVSNYFTSSWFVCCVFNCIICVCFILFCVLCGFPDYGTLEEHIIAHFLKQIGEFTVWYTLLCSDNHLHAVHIQKQNYDSVQH